MDRDLLGKWKIFVGAAAFCSALGCDEVDPPGLAKVQPVLSSEKPDQLATRHDRSETTPTSVMPMPPLVSERRTPIDENTGEHTVAEPTDPVERARMALDDGDLDGALLDAKRAVRKQPKRSAAWNTLGRVQLRLGKRKEAIDSFAQAVAQNPSSSFAHNNLGLALLYSGNYEEAVAALETATELTPVTGYMWNNLGMAYEHLDRIEEARAAYRKALDEKGEVAAQNLERLKGVQTLRVARRENENEDEHNDGNTDAGRSFDAVGSLSDGGVD